MDEQFTYFEVCVFTVRAHAKCQPIIFQNRKSVKIDVYDCESSKPAIWSNKKTPKKKKKLLAHRGKRNVNGFVHLRNHYEIWYYVITRSVHVHRYDARTAAGNTVQSLTVVQRLWLTSIANCSICFNTVLIDALDSIK